MWLVFLLLILVIAGLLAAAYYFYQQRARGGKEEHPPIPFIEERVEEQQPPPVEEKHVPPAEEYKEAEREAAPPGEGSEYISGPMEGEGREGEQAPVPQGPVGCPNGHPLVLSTTEEDYPGGYYMCANCNRVLQCSAGRWHCPNCKYDICTDCRPAGEAGEHHPIEIVSPAP